MGMPVDMFGEILKPGDIVVLRCKIESISPTEPSHECNATAKVVDGTGYKPVLALASRSCVKVREAETIESLQELSTELALKEVRDKGIGAKDA